MKKLFADPHFNIGDGLDLYMGDYNRPDPIPAAMMSALRHTESFFAQAYPEKQAEKERELLAARDAATMPPRPQPPIRRFGRLADSSRSRRSPTAALTDQPGSTDGRHHRRHARQRGQCMNDRPGIDWVQEHRNAAAREAALAVALPPPDGLQTVAYTSAGNTLIIGSAELALKCADQLCGVLPVTVLLTGGDPQDAPLRRAAMRHGHAAKSQVSGWLGAFDARWRDAGRGRAAP